MLPHLSVQTEPRGEMSRGGGARGFYSPTAGAPQTPPASCSPDRLLELTLTSTLTEPRSPGRGLKSSGVGGWVRRGGGAGLVGVLDTPVFLLNLKKGYF